MKDRVLAAFERAIAACDPTTRVAAVAPPATIGLAIGKAALAMARGANVARGLVVTPVAGDVPGWTTIVSAHPYPDARSIAAAAVVYTVVDGATAGDHVLALISGGASALVEDPRIPLPEFVATVRAVMDAGADIHELNAVRGALSNLKAGRLVEPCLARVTTLIASDVVGDDPATIGSGPTIAGQDHEAQRRAAVDVLARYGVAVPAILHTPLSHQVVARPADVADVILPMRAVAEALAADLALALLPDPYTGDVAAVAADLAHRGPCVAWGEPTLDIPADHGEGGRGQQLALELARRFRGTARWAFVAGTDGIDGPPPPGRPAPAGAFVDGATWDAIAAAGIDPARALARRDAGTALHAIGALVVTGPTGVNHADVAVLG